MRKGALILVGLAFALCFSACIGSGVSGTYECIESKGGFYGFPKGTTVEFKPGGEAVFKSKGDGPSLVGEYRVDGDRISITISVLGTKINFDGKIEGNLIKLNDGSVWQKK